MKFDGRKLKKTRLLMRLRQADIAELTRQQGQPVDSRTLSHWENCPDANPRPKNVAAVAKVLGVDTETFYSSEGKGSVQGADVLSSEAARPAHIRFWEALGYTVVQDGSNHLILQSSGRKKDVSLSRADSERIYIHAKKYTNFFLAEYLGGQGKL